VNNIYDIITHPIFSVFSGVMGFFLGHRFSLWRDRRKEFNEAAERLFESLLKESQIQQGSFSEDFAVTDYQIEALRRHLDWWQVSSYDRCVKEYSESQSADNLTHTGLGCDFTDIDRFLKAIDALMAFTKRR
jgi:hypothetical protein